MENKHRASIKSKVLKTVFAVAGFALIIISAISLFSMLRIQEQTKTALVLQMEQNLTNIATDTLHNRYTLSKNKKEVLRRESPSRRTSGHPVSSFVFLTLTLYYAIYQISFIQPR